MNAPAGFHTAARTAAEPPPADFHDPAAAWNGPRQRVVLEAFAEGCTVPDACRRVGLTPASLYAFANAPEGRRFSLGWNTAMLRSRRAIQDLALSRVVDGFEERTMRANGEVVVRHRYDNRLMMRMLERLDRFAESYGPESLSGARRLDEKFGEFLDSISDDPVANHAAIVESARPGELPGWAGRHAPVDFSAAAERMACDEQAPAGTDAPSPEDRAAWVAEPARHAEAAGPPSFVAPDEPEHPVPASPDQEQTRTAQEQRPLPDRDTTVIESQDAQHGDAPEPSGPITIRTVHDRDRTLVDMIVSAHPATLTRDQAEERGYALLRARSDAALPATLAGLRAQHGRAGHVPAAWRKLWNCGSDQLIDIGIEDLGDAPAGQGSA